MLDWEKKQLFVSNKYFDYLRCSGPRTRDLFLHTGVAEMILFLLGMAAEQNKSIMGAT